MKTGASPGTVRTLVAADLPKILLLAKSCP